MKLIQFKILKIPIIYQKFRKIKLIQFKILKIHIIYQEIQKNKTNSIQNLKNTNNISRNSEK
jgi:hypothetical protein